MGSSHFDTASSSMAPMKAMKAMKAMKSGGAALSKGAIAEALASQCDLKKSVCGKMLNSLAEIGATEVKKTGIFTMPGLCRIKTGEASHKCWEEDDVRQRGRCEG